MWYDVEPFHPKVHKRSVGSAKLGDHIVIQSTEIERENIDYVRKCGGLFASLAECYYNYGLL